MLLLAASVGLVATVALGSAVAALRLQAATTLSGRAVTAVKVVSDAAESSTLSSTFMDIPGATVTIKVPAATQALLLVRFSGESRCDISFPATCAVRVLVNGVEAQPSRGIASAFDSAPGTGPPTQVVLRQSHSIDRSAGPLDPGSYTVDVQYAISFEGGGSSFRLQDWSLTVERVKV